MKKIFGFALLITKVLYRISFIISFFIFCGFLYGQYLNLTGAAKLVVERWDLILGSFTVTLLLQYVMKYLKGKRPLLK